MACGVDNNLAKLAVKAGSGTVDFSSGATRLEFNPGETINSTNAILRGDGIRGTRAKSIFNTRLGPYSHAGTIPFDVSLTSLLAWGEFALGDNTSGVLTPTEALPVFGLIMDKVSDAFKMEGCKVSRLTISGSGSGLIKGSVDIVALSYSDSAITFPSIDLGTAAVDYPLALTDAVLTIAATAYKFNSFEIVIDNAVTPETRNSLDPDCNREGERSVTLKVQIPSTSAAWTALKAPALTGVSASLVLTSTIDAIGATFAMPVCQKGQSIPLVSSKTGQVYDLAFDCVTDDDDTEEITITCDTTGA